MPHGPTATKRPERRWRPGQNDHGGDEGIRTPGLCLAKAALSQLSYVPGNGAWDIVAIRRALVNDDTKSRPLRCVNEPTSQKVGVPIARSGFPSNGESPY